MRRHKSMSLFCRTGWTYQAHDFDNPAFIEIILITSKTIIVSFKIVVKLDKNFHMYIHGGVEHIRKRCRDGWSYILQECVGGRNKSVSLVLN